MKKKEMPGEIPGFLIGKLYPQVALFFVGDGREWAGNKLF
jgi:hypothetical protein